MEQIILIDKVRETALSDDGVSAVLMYGSFTKGEGDKYSDVEFYVFLREDHSIDKRNWISSIHPIDMFFTNEFGTDVVVFDNLIRGEFHFHPVAEIEVIHTWQGMLNFEVRDKMNLIDKDGLLTETLNNIEQLRPEWNVPENITFVADSMINNLIFVNNVIKRGEYGRAEQLFFFLKRYLVLLIRLHLNTTEHWLDPMKELEKDIPEEYYEQYRGCVPSLDVNSLKECFHNTMVLTSKLFILLDVSSYHISILKRIMHQSEDLKKHE